MKHRVSFFHANKKKNQVKKDLFSQIDKSTDPATGLNLELTGCIAQLMIECADIGAWAINAHTKEFYFTEKWATALGYQEDDYHALTIENLLDLVHPDDKDIAQSILEKQIHGEEIKCNYFLRMKSKDHQWIGMLVRGKTLVYDNDGNPLWIFGVHLDLTEFVESEIRRKELVNKTNHLHKNIPGFLYQFRMNKDGTYDFPFLTEGIEEVYGCTAEEGMKDPAKLWGLIHSEDVLRVQKTTIDSAHKHELWNQRFRILHPTKGIRWVEGRSTPQVNDDGSIVWHGYIHDDTDFQKSKDLARMATTVFNSSQEGIVVTDKYGLIEKVSPAFEKITGFAEKDILGKSFTDFFNNAISLGFYKRIKPTLIQNNSWRGEVVLTNKDNTISHILLSIDVIADDSFNDIGSYVAIFTDIGQIKQHEEDLINMANYDCLTNLPNRRLLLDKLEAALIHADQSNHKVAVCFIDLDNFKPINDKYGHAAGDDFLCKLSNSLLSSVRGHDTVARLGGDEFVILLSDVDEEAQMENMLDRISKACSQTYPINGSSIAASASIGVVVYPKVKGSADELLRFADQSMYRAKQQGRKRYVYFDQEQEDASVAHYLKVEAIKNALRNNQICLWYQPKLDTLTNKVVGVEALVRWHLTDGSFLPAKDFVNIVFGDEIDVEMGRFVIERALREQQEWRAKDINISVSVNISPDHLLSSTFKQELQEMILKYESDPKSIVIEILETSKISDFDAVVARLQECVELGVSFSLDDFGTGYSSLGYLRNLPVQEVKIDKSFIQTMLDKKEDKMIVQGIIDLSHGLDKKVLAEGVETKEHIDVLHQMGIDMVQGYEVAHPMPSELLVLWLRNGCEQESKNESEETTNYVLSEN